MKLLGQHLMARDFDRRVVEVQIRIAVMNGYTALGIPVTDPLDESVRGKGSLRHQRVCATEASQSVLPFAILLAILIGIPARIWTL